MRHNHYNGAGRFIGFYYGVSPVLSTFPEGDAGDWFLNGETCSLWMWNANSRMWIDTNRVDGGLQQMLTDEEGNSPADYVPSPSVGIKEAYFYVAENADCDTDESASPREITFTYFKNGNSSVSVEVRKTSIVVLFWNGDYWETDVVPMNVDLSLYAKDADLQAERERALEAEQANAEAVAAERSRAEAAEQVNAEAIAAERRRAESAEQANAEAVAAERSRAESAEQTNADSISAEVADRIAAITALNPQLLRGTLYLSSDSTRIYTDALMTQEYSLNEGDGAGVWLVRGSMIVGFLIQGWFQATIYPHNANYMLHWKWDAELSRWVWEDTPKTYAVTPEEKATWNDAASRLYDFLTSVDATDTAINKWKELENFLAGITDTDTLTGLLYEQETRLNSGISDETARAEEAENVLRETVSENRNLIETESSRAKAAEQQLKDGKADKVTGTESGNLPAFDITGNLLDSGIAAVQTVTHASVMPAASAENEGRVYLYTGAADGGGTFYTGNKYVCRQYDGGYRWEPLYGYVIADAIRTAGSGLPTGTVVLPLAANSVNDVVYHGGTPYVFTTSGWQVWKADTGKVTVTYTLPAASAEYLDMTFVSTNPLDGNYPPGLYQCVKSGDGYGWDKKALLCEENFTAEEKEKLAGIDSLLAEQKTSLEAKIADEASRATAAEQSISASLSDETSRATAAEEGLRTDINAVSSAMPSISDMDISEIDSLGNMAVSGTYIISDGAERGFMLFENTGNNAQRQTLYMGNTLKYRTRDAGGWGEWSVLADFGNGLATVATTGSYNDLSGKPSLSTVATTGNYESLSNRPLQGSISLSAADNLCQSYQNGVYTVTDGGITQGILFFSTAGNGGLQQYLLQDGTIKSRSGSYTGGSSSWGSWQTFDFGVSDYTDLLNQPVQIIESESYLDNLNYNNTSGIYVCKTSASAALYVSTTTSSSTYIQIQIGTYGIKYRRSDSPEALGSREWTEFIHWPKDWDDTYDTTPQHKDLNLFVEEGIYFVKGTNDKATNLPITNTGETINVAFTLLVSVSKPITLENGTERAIIGQQLTLANRIGSENKQYLRHAIADTKNGETTYTWGVWREAVTQTMLGTGGICTDADIDAAIDNGIYSGVASQSGILPAYSTFTMVVVNNYAATAAASSMGIPSNWRQVTQTIIALPLSTGGEITEGATYMRTGIGSSTITWGELKQVGTNDDSLYIAEAQTEQVWDLKKHPNWGCSFLHEEDTVVTVKLDESIKTPYRKEYHFFLVKADQTGITFNIDTDAEFEFKKLLRKDFDGINNIFPNYQTEGFNLQGSRILGYDPAPATLTVYFTGTKYYIYMDY